jgi:hypothetical protein
MWAVLVGALFGVAGIVIPSSLRHLHRIWMKIGYLLGWINSRIILSAIFYGMLTPIRVIMKIVGYDPMHRRFEQTADTYRVIRQARTASHMKRQF